MSDTMESSSAARPMSPCISVCALDATGHCSGCLRTREEIAGWLRYTPEQQWSLLRELDRRRQQRSVASQ